MRAAGQFPAHFVRNRTHVGSGGDAGAKASAIDFHPQDDKLFNLNLHRLEHNVLLLARQFVGRNAVNLFRRKRRRGLFEDAAKTACNGFHLFRTQVYRLRSGSRFAFSVVRIGGEAKSHRTFVGFLRCRVKLRQARERAHDQRQNACRHGIEGAQMPDGSFL